MVEYLHQSSSTSLTSLVKCGRGASGEIEGNISGKMMREIGCMIKRERLTYCEPIPAKNDHSIRSKWLYEWRLKEKFPPTFYHKLAL